MVSITTSVIIPLLALAISGQCRSLQQTESRSRSRRASVSIINNTTNHALFSRATKWDYVSCWRDSSSPRTLSLKVSVPGGNSNTKCQAECQSRGYIYAGTEFSGECYCDNTINNPNAQAPESDCNSKCQSDSTTCGGTWRLSIYKATTVPDPTTTAAPTPTSTVPVSIGCYQDNWSRTLPDDYMSSWSMTPELCNDYCMSKGFSYAGTETRYQCYCGKNAPTPDRKYPDSRCNQACPGRQSSMCGADWALNVYSLPATPPAPSTTSTTTAATPTSTVPLKSLPADINSFGCFSDAAGMGFTLSASGSISPSTCAKTCGDKNFSFAATQAGNQCLCGNKIDWSLKQPDTDCTSRCSGDQGYLCGSSARINVYSTSTEMTTGVAQPVGTGRKWLWAHHMIGNLQNGSISMWEEDIRLAAAAGIDGFALNMGQDSWQVDRVAQAYQAADNLKASSPFKLFLSFDMTAMYCQSDGDANYLASLVSRFSSNPYQAFYKDRVLVTTFAGDACRFGRGTAKDGWGYFRSLLKAKGVDIYLMPSIFVDTFASANMDWYDGHYEWDSAWPLTQGDLDGSKDKANLDALTPKGKGYMGNISPAFFTYYKPPPGEYAWNKNWIYRSDNWLLATRFEMLMAMRDKLDMIELTSWNDFGESHYLGPIRAEQPGSWAWTNGMPHTGWLSLVGHYAQAWKNGAYPSGRDQVVLWSRPHPKDGTPANPSMAKPRNSEWTDDNLYATVILASPADVVLRSGGVSVTYAKLPAGVNKLSMASRTGTIGAQVLRNGAVIKKWDSDGAFTYSTSFRDWNFNYFVQSF